jgi:hypothetical protein
MRSIHALVLLLIATFLAAASTGSWAALRPESLAPRRGIESPDPATLKLAARKGTRLYVGDEKAAQDRLEREKGVDPLEQCISSWSPETHIGKSKWREICQRQLRESGAHTGAATAP